MITAGVSGRGGIVLFLAAWSIPLLIVLLGLPLGGWIGPRKDRERRAFGGGYYWLRWPRYRTMPK